MILITMVISGCGKKEVEITQGITPNALNFYILNQEIGAIRDKVRASEAEQMAQYLAGYNDLLIRDQKMIKDHQTSKELKRYPEIATAMDSCLVANLEFLSLESRAIAANNQLYDVEQQLADLRRSIKNNSLLAKQQRPKLDALAAQQSSIWKQLESFKPGLSRSSQSCIRLLKKYNQLVLGGKILEYANDHSIFALFAWEKPPAVKKPAKKKR